MNLKHLALVMLMSAGLLACDKTDFVPESGADFSSTATGASSSTTGVIATTPATASEVLKAINLTQSPQISDVFRRLNAPLESLGTQNIGEVGSEPYANGGGGCPGSVSLPPVNSEPGRPVPGNTGCEELSDIVIRMLVSIDQNCHVIAEDTAQLKALLVQALRRLRNLNLTNISADIQQLVQAHIVVLERLYQNLP